MNNTTHSTQNEVVNATEAPPTPKTAWAFAGQGSQTPGMGQSIYETFPQTRALFESTEAGFDIRKFCFEASAEELGNTRYTQACMGAFAAAVVQVLKNNGLYPDITLGLSLGEYSALHAAGVLSSSALLNLLGFRGAIMADASTIPSRMTAVFGLADDVVENTVDAVAAKTGQVVSCTNYNCPGQVVIGGDEDAVLEAEAQLIECGARRCIPLNTSGPFHTALMNEPAQLLAERLAVTALGAQSVPVIFNATAAPAPDDQIKDLLLRQISSPVRFAQSVLELEKQGVTRVLEIGPGKVLAGLIKKTAPSIQVVSVQDADSLREVLEHDGTN